MDSSFLQKLVGMLRGGQGAQAAANPGYTQYAREAAAMGQTPMSAQQFALQQQAPPVQVPAVAAPPQESPPQFRF